MKTNRYSLVLSVAATACLLLSNPGARAQDADDANPAAAQMEAYMKSIAPGPEHKLMRTLVGTWKAEQTLWMAPGAPPMLNAGTAKFRMLMGGRFLVQDYASAVPGLGAFKGRGTSAFDKAAKEYVNTWFDSLGTGIMVSKGKADPANKNQISMVGEAMDAMSNQMVKFRIVTKYVSDDRHEMEMYETKPGAEERKLMQIIYTRDKAAAASGGRKGKDGKDPG